MNGSFLLNLSKNIVERIRNINNNEKSKDAILLKKFNKEILNIFKQCLQHVKINYIFNKFHLYQKLKINLTISLNDILTILHYKQQLIVINNNNLEYKNLKLQYIEDTKDLIKYLYQKYDNNKY